MSTERYRQRRTFTEEFKRNAVNLVVNEGYSISEAARAVDVNPANLRLWYRKLAPAPKPSGPDVTKEELQAEVKRLRHELREAQLDNEILKKATAYFAKESQ